MNAKKSIVSLLIALVLFSAVALSRTDERDNGKWERKEDLPHRLQEHKCSLLPKERVLLAGGTAKQVLSDAFLFDRNTGKWIRTTNMLTPRAEHKLVTLKDGRVLAIGGAASSNGQHRLRDCEIYDSETQKWERTGDMNYPRAYAGATALTDGRVLVGGGGDAAECEIFDPGKGKWTLAEGWKAGERVAMTLMNDGNVFCLSPQEARIYSPQKGNWTVVPPLENPRTALNLVTTKDGGIMAIGGFAGGKYLNSCDIFHPEKAQWTSVAPLNTARSLAFAAVLSDGRIVVCGGRTGFPAGKPPLSTAETEMYDPSTNTWSTVAPLHSPTQEAGGVVFSSDQIMVCGGWSGKEPLNSTELFTPPDKSKK